MDTPQDPTPTPQTPQPDQPHQTVPPTEPAQPAPGTALPSEESALAERGDEQFVSGEGGEGGEPYDGGEIPQVDAPAVTEQVQEDLNKPNDSNDAV